MAFTELIATPDFEHIRQETGVDTEDAIRLIWLMLQDEINRRERLASSVGGTTGHNLLSATHPDTIPADPVQGDLIQALGSTPVDSGKYWMDALAIIFEDLNADTKGVKYWADGGAFLQDGFNQSGGSGVKWQRHPLGAAGTALLSDGTQAVWTALSTQASFLGTIAPTYVAFNGNNNDVTLGDYNILPIDADAGGLGGVIITGLTDGEEGRVVFLVNVSAGVGDFQLAEEDVNSAATNRFRIAIAPRQPGSVVVLVYVDGRWNVNS